MKLLELKIRRFKEPITGILLKQGTHWYLAKQNVVDYMLDGFIYINRHFVVYENEIHRDTTLYKILSLKNEAKKDLYIYNDSILNGYDSFFSFLKTNQILVAVCLHNEDVIYVGKIMNVGSMAFILSSYDTDLNERGTMKIPFYKVRYIQMHTDYLDSLNLLLENRNNRDGSVASSVK